MSLLQCFYCHQNFHYTDTIEGLEYWCSNDDCSRQPFIKITDNVILFQFVFIIDNSFYLFAYDYSYFNRNHFDLHLSKDNKHIFLSRELPGINPFLPDDVLESKIRAMLLLL